MIRTSTKGSSTTHGSGDDGELIFRTQLLEDMLGRQDFDRCIQMANEENPFFGAELSDSFDMYLEMESQETLKLFVAQTKYNEVVGVSMHCLWDHPHLDTGLHSSQIVEWLDGKYRLGSNGLRMLRFADDQLKECGVRYIHRMAPTYSPQWGKILERLGHEEIETLWVKEVF